MDPILTKWINTVQDTFDKYLARAVQLETWQFVSGAKYSTSMIDLFTFLEQPITLLHKVYIVYMYIHILAYITQWWSIL
jgi:hypothetical protein